MSRYRFDAERGGARVVVCGYDRPFKTFYAQLWDRNHDPDFDNGAPEAAVGYHPAEQGIPPFAGEQGPYPVATAEALIAYIDRCWGAVVPRDIRQRLCDDQPK